MNKIALPLMMAITTLGCSIPEENHAQKAFEHYTSFVDSIFKANEIWKKVTDTDYVEILMNPDDLSKTRIDTILTSPSAKTSMLLDAYRKTEVIDRYVPLKAEADSKFALMDSASQSMFKEAQKKFESLLVE